jgi:hypothetical protein
MPNSFFWLILSETFSFKLLHQLARKKCLQIDYIFLRTECAIVHTQHRPTVKLLNFRKKIIDNG